MRRRVGERLRQNYINRDFVRMPFHQFYLTVPPISLLAQFLQENHQTRKDVEEKRLQSRTLLIKVL